MSFIQRIRNILRPVLTLGILSVILSGCSEELPEDTQGARLVGDNIVLKGSIEVPGMSAVLSRGAFGDAAGEGLKLSIFEFDLGKDATQSFLSRIYHVDNLTPGSDVANGVTVSFNLTLKSSSTPKVLHFFLTDEYLNSDFGSVASIIPSLTVGGNTEAYWGQVEFPDGYTVTDGQGNVTLRSDLEGKLTEVPLIRNFAKISVEVAENVNFRVLGFDIINVPGTGTIAPWNQRNFQVPDLLKTDNTMKDYSDISYQGIVAGDALFQNTESTAKGWDGTGDHWKTTSAYIYEHPYESTRRSYLIIHGEYLGTEGFYKVDLGKLENGNFQNYNIIRNIHYQVKITDVNAAGAATVAEAIERPPFNNLSAATETSSMLNISDNKNLLIVNDTNHIIVEDNAEVEVLYRYITGIDNNNRVDRPDIPKLVGLETGLVIDSWTGPTEVGINGERWMRILIKCNNPDDDVKIQSLTVTNNNGLSRTIRLILRKPWRYARLKNADGSLSTSRITVAQGIENSYPSVVPENISPLAGEPLTVYFDLPNGLDEAMFPLDFQLESEYQGMENNQIGDLVVTTGPSLFDADKIAISYVKSVSYEEYIYNHKDNSNDLDVNSSNVNHTIRCRFKTISEVPSGSTAAIRVYNPYFRGVEEPTDYLTVSFTRN